jgi:hypothetical protein
MPRRDPAMVAQEQSRLTCRNQPYSFARRCGRRAEARKLLTAIYDGFTEGFDALDPIGAKTLLDQLA